DDVAEVYLDQLRLDDALFHLVLADQHDPTNPARTKKLIDLCLARGYHDRAARAVERHERAHGADEHSREARQHIASATGQPLLEGSPIARGEAFLWGRLRARIRRTVTDELPVELRLVLARIGKE